MKCTCQPCTLQLYCHANGFRLSLFCSLGQLASLAGIDKSDFQPPGRPRFSSTMGPPLGGAESLTRGRYRDVGTRTDALSLVRVSKAVFGKHCGVIIPAVFRFHVCSESNFHQFYSIVYQLCVKFGHLYF